MAKYKRMGKKSLPGNIRVTRTTTIGPQKGRVKKMVRFIFANKPTQDKSRRIKRKYRTQRLAQTGRGLVGDLAKLGIRIGSKAIYSDFGK